MFFNCVPWLNQSNSENSCDLYIETKSRAQLHILYTVYVRETESMESPAFRIGRIEILFSFFWTTIKIEYTEENPETDPHHIDS